MDHRIEEDKKIMEAFGLNQFAVGNMQQRDNKNLKYPPKYDSANSNYKTFAGMSGRGNANDARIPSGPDLSSDEEGKDVAGYIYDSEITNTTPENPEIVVVGLGRYRLDSLESDIRDSLKQLSTDSVSNIIFKITKDMAVLPHKIKALEEVIKKMESPVYKRKITLAKRKR